MLSFDIITIAATLLLSLSPAASFIPTTSFVHQSARCVEHGARTTGLQMSSIDAAAKSKYSKVFVAGGTRGVGRLVVEKLIASGSEVVALARNDEAISELNKIEGVTAVKGDAFDYKSVEGAMDGCDAAITLLGRGANAEEDEKRVDYEGNSNVIEAAGILGVTRVVLVTSIGCGSSKEAVPPSVLETLKDALTAKQKAENMLIKYYTNTNWTIIRPGGLKSEPATGTAIVSEDNLAIGTIHREDVADLVVKVLTSSKTQKKILSAIDPKLVSSASTDDSGVEEYALA